MRTCEHSHLAPETACTPTNTVATPCQIICLLLALVLINDYRRSFGENMNCPSRFYSWRLRSASTVRLLTRQQSRSLPRSAQWAVVLILRLLQKSITVTQDNSTDSVVEMGDARDTAQSKTVYLVGCGGTFQHSCKFSIWEAEARGWQTQGQPRLHELLSFFERFTVESSSIIRILKEFVI